MITARATEWLLWSVAIGATVLGLAGVWRVLPQEGHPDQTHAARAGSKSGIRRVAPVAPTAAVHGADSLMDVAAAITAADPFRLDRHPSTVAYRPELEGVPPAPPPPVPPKPALTLAGLVGGPTWAALVDGIPGRDGSTLVHVGDVVGALRVRNVSPAGVTISGMDTTWHLTLKRPWP
jgi:hypothetical protein